jgi:alcohol dehydrogenase (cytochrome c)
MDYTGGYSIVSAPLPVGDLVVTGVAGGEYPTQGFIVAYDAATGAERWRFNTIPKAGDPAAATWAPDVERSGGPTWGVGAYDPELGLLFWGVGDPAPDYNKTQRPGDDLYSSCLVALDVKTGKLRWYYQFLPGDDHDWDSTQTPSLIDFEQDGAVHKWIAVANRGGFFYVLDRETGHFVRGAPFAKVTWAKGLDPATGRPIPLPYSSPTPSGTLIYPSGNGATNWWPSAYSPLTHLYYVSVEEGAGVFFRRESPRRRGQTYTGGFANFGDESFTDFVRAIDPATAQVRWERKNTTITRAPRGGLTATAGGLLFGSDGAVLYALDAATGKEVWSFHAGGHISAPPITYHRDGQQVLAVVASQDVFTFALPREPAPVVPVDVPPRAPLRTPHRRVAASTEGCTGTGRGSTISCSGPTLGDLRAKPRTADRPAARGFSAPHSPRQPVRPR